MKKILIVIVLLSIFSCTNEKVIRYKYKNVTLTRVDKSGETFIYYGNFKKDKFPSSFLKISYSGLNSGFSGFLVFNRDNTVTAVPILGYFEMSKNADTRISIRNDSQKSWFEDIIGRYDNVVEITEVNSERAKNKLNLSNVSAIYPK